MLDINFVRANLEITRTKLEQRAFPLNTLDRFNELDERRRTLIHERDELNATRNRESQAIGTLMKAGKKDEAESRRAAVRDLGDRIAAIETGLSAVEPPIRRSNGGVRLRCLTSSLWITSIWEPLSGYWILNARPGYRARASRFSLVKARDWNGR